MQLNVNATIPYIIKASLKLQASVIHKAIYYLPSTKDNLWMDTVSFIVTTSPSCQTSVTKQNANPMKLIGEKDRIGIVNT